MSKYKVINLLLSRRRNSIFFNFFVDNLAFINNDKCLLFITFRVIHDCSVKFLNLNFRGLKETLEIKDDCYYYNTRNFILAYLIYQNLIEKICSSLGWIHADTHTLYFQSLSLNLLLLSFSSSTLLLSLILLLLTLTSYYVQRNYQNRLMIVILTLLLSAIG